MLLVQIVFISSVQLLDLGAWSGSLIRLLSEFFCMLHCTLHIGDNQMSIEASQFPDDTVSGWGLMKSSRFSVAYSREMSRLSKPIL